MLVLSRKRREAILIGDGIVCTVLKIRKGRVRLGIAAPDRTSVVRGECPPITAGATAGTGARAESGHAAGTAREPGQG